MPSKTIKTIKFQNFLGIKELEFDTGKVNLITGKKGSGKTSVLDAIEKTINGKIDTKEERGLLPDCELVRHNENEAILFVQTNDGMEILRKLRPDTTNYLKVSKLGEAIPSTETYLRKLFNGDIFRPMEFLKKSSEEQASIILDMLDIQWNMDNISNWFGEIPDVNFSMHILKILKQIESFYYEKRTAVNREVEVLKNQAAGFRTNLPANYDGNTWENKNVQEYYDKVSKAEENNKNIENLNNAISGIIDKINSINLELENEKNKLEIQVANEIEIIKNENETFRKSIETFRENIKSSQKDIEDGDSEDIKSLESEIESLKKKYATKKEDRHKSGNEWIESYKKIISSNESSILDNDKKIISKGDMKAEKIKALNELYAEKVKTAKAETSTASEEIKLLTVIDVEPLKKDAEEVSSMRQHLFNWKLMNEIMLDKLPPKEAITSDYTAKIEKARSLPLELLKISKCPIDGISVDDAGKLRINGTLINGLSTGEKKELAMKIAKFRASQGQFRFICFDGFESLNPDEQNLFIKKALEDEFEWFITNTTDGEFGIEILGLEEN